MSAVIWDTARQVFKLGDVVRKLRQERRWSLDELASASGVNRMTLSAIERDETDPRSSTIDRIAKAFGLAGSAELYALIPRVTSPVTHVREVPDREYGEDEILDVSGYEKFSIPVIAEGDASPEGLIWSDEGVKLIEAEEWMSRPNDPAVRDPMCYGVKVRGDSMEPLLEAGMRVIVSPNLSIGSKGLGYVQLRNGERLIKMVHAQAGGYTLESFNRNYPPRFVEREAVKAIHRIAYIRTLK